MLMTEDRRVALRGQLADLNKSIGNLHDAAEKHLADATAIEIPADAEAAVVAELREKRNDLRARANLSSAKAMEESNQAADIRGTLARTPVVSANGFERPSAFSRFCLHGHKGLDADEREMFTDESQINAGGETPAGGQYFRLSILGREMDRVGHRIQNAEFKSGEGNEGEALMPIVPRPAAFRLKSFGAVSRVVIQERTPNGNRIPYPYFDDLANEAAAGAQGVAAVEKAIPKPAAINLDAVDVNSGFANVQLQAEQDNPMLGDTVERLLLRRIGRFENEQLTTGSTAGNPLGVVTTAKEALTTAASGAVGYNDLVDLMDAPDDAYIEDDGEGGEFGFMTNAQMGMVGWMMSRNARAHLMKRLVDTQGRPYWVDVAGGAPNTLLGYPVNINNNMAAVAANAYPILFGNFGTYVHRMVDGVDVFRIVDGETIKKKQARYIAWARHDGSPVEGVESIPATRHTMVSEAIQKLKVKP